MAHFDQLVPSEISRAVPAGQAMAVTGALPPGVRRFRLNGGALRIHVLALDVTTVPDTGLEARLLAFRDACISRKELLLLITESEQSPYNSDLDDLIDETLRIDHPCFLALACYRDQQLKTTIDGSVFEDLHLVIRDLWSGRLRFEGPQTGLQQVNIELMAEACWKCGQPVRTVTGLVFPDRQLDRWDNDHWRYYQQLLPLAALNDAPARVIQAFTESLRRNDPLVTPVAYRYSHFAGSSYWAAACPHCGVLRGNFHAQDDRLDHLHDFSGRYNGELQYHVVRLAVDLAMIRSLSEGSEYCPHSRPMGWLRPWL